MNALTMGKSNNMANRKRSLKSQSKIYTNSRKTMQCKVCGGTVHGVSADAIAVECPLCLNRQVPCDETTLPAARSEPIGPKGWHLRNVFVTEEGVVYHKGVEQPKLKGTLPATVIEKKTVAEKRKKLEAADRKLLKLSKTVNKRKKTRSKK